MSSPDIGILVDEHPDDSAKNGRFIKPLNCYHMPVQCSNCHWRGYAIIPKGVSFSSVACAHSCPNCSILGTITG